GEGGRPGPLVDRHVVDGKRGDVVVRNGDRFRAQRGKRGRGGHGQRLVGERLGRPDQVVVHGQDGDRAGDRADEVAGVEGDAGRGVVGVAGRQVGADRDGQVLGPGAGGVEGERGDDVRRAGVLRVRGGGGRDGDGGSVVVGDGQGVDQVAAGLQRDGVRRGA